MTEPTPEAPAPAAAETRRGRPRPEATIERDKVVLAALAVPMTRGQLVDATGLTPNQVYLSLYRLRVNGDIVRDRSGAAHVWKLNQADAVPA